MIFFWEESFRGLGTWSRNKVENYTYDLGYDKMGCLDF